MAEVEGNALIVRRKPLQAKAIQFNGTNGSEVVAFIRAAGREARNGGSYVKLIDDATGRNARKGDYVIHDATGRVEIFDEVAFARLFSIKA